jgi:hypothetical protein
MTLQQTFEARRLARRRSLLVPWGAVLVALAFLLPRPLSAAATQMSGLGRNLAFIATDIFRAGFFIGIACLVIGSLRNRRWKLEAKAAYAGSARPEPGAVLTGPSNDRKS